MTPALCSCSQSLGHPSAGRGQPSTVRQWERERAVVPWSPPPTGATVATAPRPGPFPLTLVGPTPDPSQAPPTVTASHLREHKGRQRSPRPRPGLRGEEGSAERPSRGKRGEPGQRREGRGKSADTGAKDTSRHSYADPGCTAPRPRVQYPRALCAGDAQSGGCRERLAVAAPGGSWPHCAIGRVALQSWSRGE